MSKVSAALMVLGVTGAITLIAVSSLMEAPDDVQQSPCPKEQVLVWVDKEPACIDDSLDNRKAAMYAELTTPKKNTDNKDYDVEIGNWEVFWTTLSEASGEKGLTSEELKALIDNNKQEIINILKP